MATSHPEYKTVSLTATGSFCDSLKGAEKITPILIGVISNNGQHRYDNESFYRREKCVPWSIRGQFTDSSIHKTIHFRAMSQRAQQNEAVEPFVSEA